VGKELIDAAKEYNLKVHVWTFIDFSEERKDSIVSTHFKSEREEYEYIYNMGISIILILNW